MSVSLDMTMSHSVSIRCKEDIENKSHHAKAIHEPITDQLQPHLGSTGFFAALALVYFESCEEGEEFEKDRGVGDYCGC